MNFAIVASKGDGTVMVVSVVLIFTNNARSKWLLPRPRVVD